MVNSNQYFTKSYVSQALLDQHRIFASSKSIKLVLNFNGVDYVLVQKCNENGHLVTHQFYIIDKFWHSDDNRYINAITLRKSN
jgi:hypothetical protein